MEMDIVRAVIAEYGSPEALAEYVLAHQSQRVYKMFDISGNTRVVSGEAEAVSRLRSYEPGDDMWCGFSIEAGDPETIVEIVRREDVVKPTDESFFMIFGSGRMRDCLTLVEAREIVRRLHKKYPDNIYTIIDERGWSYLIY